MDAKLHREIAILEAEAVMIETHAEKLFKTAAHLPESQQHQETLALAEDESQRAAAIRAKIYSIKQSVGV
jgi:hypothetical protein